MKRNVLVIIALALLLGWGGYDYVDEKSTTKQLFDQQQKGEAGVVGIKKGNIAPDFELLNLEEEVKKLSDYRGKVVFLNFWASWCPPCKAEMPYMQQYSIDYANEVVVLGVNLTSTESSKQDVSDFLEKLQITFPVLLDSEGLIRDIYKIKAYPTTFILDQNGVIQAVHQGAMSYEQMRKATNKIYDAT